MMTHRWLFIVCLVCSIAACSRDNPAGPSQSGETPVEIAGLTVSNSVVANVTSPGIAVTRAEGGSAYISAAPHTFSNDAFFASITNETSDVARASRMVVEGGFDPVKLDAKEGDSVSIAVFRSGGDLLSVVHTKIPARRPPRVVRTSPGKGRVDVALNTLVEIVFSEPIDKTSVTPASVRLLKDQVEVGGTLAVTSDGLMVRFTPMANTLEPSATYSLVLDPSLRDLDGETLADPGVAEFKTVTGQVSGTILVLVETTLVSDAPVDPDGYVVELDSQPGERIATGEPRTFLVSGAAHSVDLTGLSFNCVADESYRSVSVSHGGTTVVQFRVTCTPPPPLQGMLAFLSDRDGNTEIYTSNADGTNIRRLTNTIVPEWDPEWSPDGTKLAFARSRVQGEPSEYPRPSETDIYVMDADGSNVIRLTEGGTNYHPVWSPDGKRIAYVVSVSGAGTVIRVVSLDGQPATPALVGYDLGVSTDPAWSPDGQYIVFASDWLFFDLATFLFRVRADGSEPPTLVQPFADVIRNRTSVYSLQPSWSPDGTRIAFAECDFFYICWGPGAIAVIGSDGSGYARLVQTSNTESVTWSPDGEYIAYSSQACRLCSPPSISYVSSDGTKMGHIISNASSPSWRPSGR